MKNSLGIFVVLLVFTLSINCNPDKSLTKQAAAIPFTRDLNEIKKDGKLKVLLAYSSTSYFLYKANLWVMNMNYCNALRIIYN